MPITHSSFSQSSAVAIVVCTYNGSQYIESQTESLLAQSHEVSIHVSDDVSNDETVAKVSNKLRSGIDTLHVNPNNIGFVRNFEQGLKRVVEAQAEYVALSDQDDIWDEQRIATGMQAMSDLESLHGHDVPLLVHSDLRLINTNAEQSHPSFLAYRKYRITSRRCLNIILGENGVMGNTVLMNRALAELCLPFPESLHVHDYWIALMAELFGYRAMVDKPLVNYRLHESNASNTAESMSRGLLACLGNIHWRKLLARDFKLPFKEDSRMQVLKEVLANPGYYPALSDEQMHSINLFVNYLDFSQPRFKSLGYLMTSGVARSSFRFRIRLIFAVLLTTRYAR
ncbi:MAG: glycosyltransferase family 2 protein [Granulosicoccus sp.]